MLWDIAAASDGISTGIDGLLQGSTGRVLKSLNAALEAAELGLSSEVSQYVGRRLFGGDGHAVRHRRSPGLNRRWSAYALIALRGVFDDIQGERLIPALGERLTALSTEAAPRSSAPRIAAATRRAPDPSRAPTP